MEKAVLTEECLAMIEKWNASFLHALKARRVSRTRISLCAYRLQAAERKIDVKVRNMGY